MIEMKWFVLAAAALWLYKSITTTLRNSTEIQ